MADKKHTLPYRTWEEAVKDGFKKIGGTEGAWSMLDAGNYAQQERKLQNDKNTRIRELLKSDPRFKSIREEAKKKIGK